MDNDLKQFEKNLQNIIAGFKNEISGIRANRPSPKLVEDIKVDYFDQKMTVKQLGSIAIVPPREININIWDKGAVGSVAKAIEVSGLGLSANIDGNLIRLNLPQLTDERRQELAKLIKSLAENFRIKIRSSRDDINKKAKALPDEDDKFKALKKTQELVDKYNKEVENSLLTKIQEING